MTWEDLEAETAHSARSIATMKTMNKAPSFHFALAIAKALGTTVEHLASETNNKSLLEGTMRDVLYKICDKHNENDIFMLACVAKSISESMQAEDSQSLDDAMEADKVFDELMGEDVLCRKEFIRENAKFVNNLDI